ncbi:unnamed protein product [Euphydryas editha]|uniref:ZAD domain-containing protein n=1 Tax=Euphydryas editha TaxID=104508 RepID=A0AAU9U9H1_EUPED|nr:unnamed protein product [Euphydryas editha]
MKSMDFKNICRLCLESKKQYHDIYNTYYAKKNLLYCEMISNCTKIKPMEKDGLPRLICKDCSRQLKRTYAFNEQCENSEKTLKAWLHSSVGENLTSDGHDKNGNRELHELNIINNKDDESAFHDDDDCWDAEDDNMILEQIKLDKALTESSHHDNNIESQDRDFKTNNATESSTTEVVKGLLKKDKTHSQNFHK